MKEVRRVTDKRAKNYARVAIIICYFGKFPWYFDYFIHSCRHNPTVDFFILTDQPIDDMTLPDNVVWSSAALQEIETLATAKLGFNVTIKWPYKICDFRPAYGVIFSDILIDYDFWGYGDIDVIYGNLRDFITKEVLQKFELINVRPDWIPGCFALFKNIKKMNELFTRSKDYKKVMQGDFYYNFDETNFAHSAFSEGVSADEIVSDIESITHVVKKMQKDGSITAYFDLHIVEGVPGRLKWEKGVLTYRNCFEVLLYHLIWFKKAYHPKRKLKVIPSSLTFSPSRIYHNHSR